ncbi:unnamed protein product [Trichogramma brassicae]|uniref:Uncharacterized protein n=1 Tax=Trichogramma brassicae TaxID=86971 RepID=A0A6H5INZ5_9HYME|nr:unnamed protein product [Trichogramma brassicae]
MNYACWGIREYSHERLYFVEFVVRTGYKIEPEVDDKDVESAMLLIRRTTPVHHAHWHNNGYIMRDLFKIYDRYDVNYIDEFGYTHFHLACKFGHRDVVERFLELGQDPDLLVSKTGDSPLHLALAGAHKEVAESLLKHGADPNLANHDGQTPLHVVCRRVVRDDLAEIFFGACDVARRRVRVNAGDRPNGDAPLHLALHHARNEKLTELLLRRGADPDLANDEGFAALHVIAWNGCDDGSAELFLEACAKLGKPVRLDARDEKGRSPLQWAVARFMPNAIDALLDRGADLSSFRFPTEDYFGKRFKPPFGNHLENMEVRLAAGALDSLERLERRGYEPKPSDVLTIMKFFAKNNAFVTSANRFELPPDHYWHSRRFQEEAKKTMINPSVSLYDLIQPQPEKATKLVTYTEYVDFYELSRERLGWPWLRDRHEENLAVHLCELLSRRFFRSWAVHRLMELTHYRLPFDALRKLPKKLHEACVLHLCETISRGFFRSWATISFLDLTRCRLPVSAVETSSRI